MHFTIHIFIKRDWVGVTLTQSIYVCVVQHVLWLHDALVTIFVHIPSAEMCDALYILFSFLLEWHIEIHARICLILPFFFLRTFVVLCMCRALAYNWSNAAKK